MRVALDLLRTRPLRLSFACGAADEEWIQLFNGRDLTGWTPKLTHHELGDNFARHVPRRGRAAEGALRPLPGRLQDALRPPVLREALLLLPAARRVPLRRRAGGARTGRLGEPQQRHHVPFAAAADDDEGAGLSDLDRGAVARRTQRRQGAADREHVLARHGSRLQRRAVPEALPGLGVEDLRRRSMGEDGARRARRRARSRTS